jgi:cytochrome c peroxidase
MLRRGSPPMKIAAGIVVSLTIAVFLILATLRNGSDVAPHLTSEHTVRVQARENEPIRPIPLQLNLDAQKVSLGEKLFHEPALSKNNSVACSDCHSLKNGGADGRVRSIGMNKSEGALNAPTVLNSGFNFRQFWDGRASNLEEQIEGPVQAPIEMGSTWEEVLKKLRNSTEYAAEFNRIYGDGIQRENVKDAIAEFERSLFTPNSPIDQYLRGNDHALDEKQKEGYRRFKAYGCVSCHQGINVGGNMYARLGAVEDYFAARGDSNVTKADLGRYNVTGLEEDKYVFKVPSLRNVALTAPYFHDGSAPNLRDAVATMARYQLGRELSSEDIDYIVAFLHSLTGEIGGKK